MSEMGKPGGFLAWEQMETSAVSGRFPGVASKKSGTLFTGVGVGCRAFTRHVLYARQTAGWGAEAEQKEWGMGLRLGPLGAGDVPGASIVLCLHSRHEAGFQQELAGWPEEHRISVPSTTESLPGLLLFCLQTGCGLAARGSCLPQPLKQACSTLACRPAALPARCRGSLPRAPPGPT